MSENKKYYWLKLKDNFFDTEDLILLETMPDGIIYSNILLKLYLKSIKNDGKLMYKDKIPYNPVMLSQLIRHPVGVIEKALKIFQDMGLVDVLDSGAIYMLDIQNFIGKSSTEADRIRDYREKIKQEGCTNVRTNVHQSIEIRDKRLEKEKERKKVKKEKSKSTAVAFDYSSFSNDEIHYIDRWFSYRNEMKKPLKTQASYTTLRNQLLQFKQNGTLKPSIDIAISSGWQGLFEQKKYANQETKHTQFKNVERTGDIATTDW